jgi:hypothetical protein
MLTRTIVLFAILFAALPVCPEVRAINGQNLRFSDIAAKAGLTARNVSGGDEKKRYILEMNGSGAAVLDYNRDGLPDLFLVNGTTVDAKEPGPTSHLYRNNGDGSFTDVTREAGLTYSGWGQGACVADIDNDGDEDLFVTYFGKNRLYRNNGNGTFTDIAERAGVAGAEGRWNSGCAFTDFDRDGRVDLFVANYVDLGVNFTNLPAPGSGQYCMYKSIPIPCGPRGLPKAPNYLFHNNGDGTFQDFSLRSGIRETNGHYSLGVVVFDYDLDGWPDIYVACDSAPSSLFHNNHDGTFRDRGVATGTAYNDDGEAQGGMGVAVLDYDRDGRFDLLKTNFSDDSPNLYHGLPDGTFSDQVFTAGLGRKRNYMGWGAIAADFSNNGWPDIVMVNGHLTPEVDRAKLDSPYRQRKLYYRNLQNGAFENAMASAGPAFEAARVSRGAAAVDLSNDGKIAVLVNEMGDPPSLLLPEGKFGHWIGIRTIGVKSNRDGIGLRAVLKTGNLVQMDEVRSGGSYLSSGDLRLHFGLGERQEVEELKLYWPSGQVDTLKNIPADRQILVQEGLSEWKLAQETKH